jgi:hypothetical protein
MEGGRSGGPTPTAQITAPAATARSRPKKGSTKVAPAAATGEGVDDDVRGACGRCGQPVLSKQHRTVQKGVYFHDACPESLHVSCLLSTAAAV